MDFLGSSKWLHRVVLLLAALVIPECTARTRLLNALASEGYPGENALLRCRLTTGMHNRGWLRLSWVRMAHNGLEQPIAYLPVQTKESTFAHTLDHDLKARIKPFVTVQSGFVEFNLQISNLSCQDRGLFKCRAMTPLGEHLATADLNIKAHPQAPKITVDHVMSRGRRQMHLTCEADVGFPPQKIFWFERKPESSYFKLIERQKDYVERASGCHVIQSRVLQISVARTRRGTLIRCGYLNHKHNVTLHDQIRLPGNYYTDSERAVKKRTGDQNCPGNQCQVGRSTLNNKAAPMSSDKFQVLLLQFVIFMLFRST